MKTESDLKLFLEAILAHADSVLVLSLVLPSRQETCRFHLNLQTATVGQLINEIQMEDEGVEQVHVYTDSGNVLSKSYSIHSLLQSAFTIQLNQQRAFLFDPIHNLQTKQVPNRARNRVDGLSREDTVATLYHALNIMKVYHSKHLELQNEASELSAQLEPMEKVSKCKSYPVIRADGCESIRKGIRVWGLDTHLPTINGNGDWKASTAMKTFLSMCFSLR